MSLRLRQLSGREVAAALVRFGFEVVASRGSHCKLRRMLPSGERQTLTIPMHASLAPGTLHAIYRHACRFLSENALQPHFYSGEPSTRARDLERQEPEHTGGGQGTKDKRRGRKPRGRRR